MSSQRAFPSGHTANSFAIARLFYRNTGCASASRFYIAGVFTVAGRMEGDKHYLSDVVMGAVLGGIVSNAVTLRELWADTRPTTNQRRWPANVIICRFIIHPIHKSIPAVTPQPPSSVKLRADKLLFIYYIVGLFVLKIIRDVLV